MLFALPEWIEPSARYIFETGLPTTLRIAAFSVVASAIIGVVLGTLLTLHFLPSRALIRLYIEVWRGLPIIVTIFIVFFVFPKAGPVFAVGPVTGAANGPSLWGSARGAEATRGAVQSIPREQHQAAAALGFGWVGRHVHVVLPQASRRLLPPLVGLLVGIIQNSTLAQILGVPEVLETGKREYERLQQPPPFGTGNPHALEIYGAVLVFFFLISFPLTRLAAYLERRLI